MQASYKLLLLHADVVKHANIVWTCRAVFSKLEVLNFRILAIFQKIVNFWTVL